MLSVWSQKCYESLIFAEIWLRRGYCGNVTFIYVGITFFFINNDSFNCDDWVQMLVYFLPNA